MTSVFYLFRDATQRRAALELETGSSARYALYGMDELVARGYVVRHNLERPRPSARARVAGSASKRALEAAGGYGGDFATVLSSLGPPTDPTSSSRRSTRWGSRSCCSRALSVVRSPFVYVAIGLPERLARLGSRRMEGLYARALGAASTIVAYSEHEADVVRRWLRDRGVDARSSSCRSVSTPRRSGRPVRRRLSTSSRSARTRTVTTSCCSSSLARCRRRASCVVTTAERARALDDRPANVAVETDLPFDAMRDRLERARVVALPVRENSYSGATTVLLQAMALAKPVVVTRTAAIAAGYGLVDGENLRLAAPGDTAGFGRSLADLLRDEGGVRALGLRARATVEARSTGSATSGGCPASSTEPQHGRDDTPGR